MTAQRQTTRRRTSTTRPAATPPPDRAGVRTRAKTRAKPGARGQGDFYHVEVRPRSAFTTFRTQDVGRPGGIERVAGRRDSGAWDTQKWLIAKDQAHIEGRTLVGDTTAARRVLGRLGSSPVRLRGDRFRAVPRAKSSPRAGAASTRRARPAASAGRSTSRGKR